MSLNTKKFYAKILLNGKYGECFEIDKKDLSISSLKTIAKKKYKLYFELLSSPLLFLPLIGGGSRWV